MTKAQYQGFSDQRHREDSIDSNKPAHSNSNSTPSQQNICTPPNLKNSEIDIKIEHEDENGHEDQERNHSLAKSEDNFLKK